MCAVGIQSGVRTYLPPVAGTLFVKMYNVRRIHTGSWQLCSSDQQISPFAWETSRSLHFAWATTVSLPSVQNYRPYIVFSSLLWIIIFIILLYFIFIILYPPVAGTLFVKMYNVRRIHTGSWQLCSSDQQISPFAWETSRSLHFAWATTVSLPSVQNYRPYIVFSSLLWIIIFIILLYYYIHYIIIFSPSSFIFLYHVKTTLSMFSCYRIASAKFIHSTLSLAKLVYYKWIRCLALSLARKHSATALTKFLYSLFGVFWRASDLFLCIIVYFIQSDDYS